MELAQDTKNAMEQFNQLFGNMFTFTEEDMPAYDACYEDVFSRGITISFMSAVFYAQFSAELVVGLLASNPLRKYMIQELDKEKERTEDTMKYWHESMNEKRFGLEGIDYTQDTQDLMEMANVSYIKAAALNDWFGTENGKKEFDMYCLSKKAVRDIKRIICEYPYLMRRYDYDQVFANEIMEYAGIVANQIADAE